MKHSLRLFVLLFFSTVFLNGPESIAQPVFKVIPLGVKGGTDESDLSCYMLAVDSTNNYVCLDAGTVYYGIKKSVDLKLFPVDAREVLRSYIKGYLISHAHLDHVAGLIINSPGDSSKNIYGLPFCLNILKSNYFTWKSWANFTNEGDSPRLNKYHYVDLAPYKEIPLANTLMNVKSFPLSHGNPYESTAFLVRYKNDYLLYLGDTGTDSIEHSDKLQRLWMAVAPLIKEKKLKAIFIETSFPNEQPDKLLFGHLTPKLLMGEMQKLSILAGVDAMKDLPVVITHIKPDGDNENKIRTELLDSNELQLKLIFPRQARLLEF
jgi:cAMP phosphodiesterase